MTFWKIVGILENCGQWVIFFVLSALSRDKLSSLWWILSELPVNKVMPIPEYFLRILIRQSTALQSNGPVFWSNSVQSVLTKTFTPQNILSLTDQKLVLAPSMALFRWNFLSMVNSSTVHQVFNIWCFLCFLCSLMLVIIRHWSCLVLTCKMSSNWTQLILVVNSKSCWNEKLNPRPSN